MSLVPSHDCSHLREAAGNTGLPTDSHRSIRPFRSAHAIYRTYPIRGLVRLLKEQFLSLTAAQFICSRGVIVKRSIHAHNKGVFYDFLQEMAVGSCSAGIGNGRRDGPVAGSYHA